MYRALLTFTLGSALSAGLGLSCYAQSQEADPAAQTQPDNTKVNKRDRQQSEVTADQQRETSSDRDLAKKIRKAITADKSLSTYAHNVKVIAQNGTVTLKGPVHSEEEGKAIEAKAVEVAGPSNVKNELSVKGDK
jgi:osmotically-inducible protein OsmY